MERVTCCLVRTSVKSVQVQSVSPNKGVAFLLQDPTVCCSSSAWLQLLSAAQLLHQAVQPHLVAGKSTEFRPAACQ